MDLASSSIRDAQISLRGAKYALIENNKHSDGKLKIILGNKREPCVTPLGANTFNNEDNKRKNIQFTITPTEEQHINSVYDWSLE